MIKQIHRLFLFMINLTNFHLNLSCIKCISGFKNKHIRKLSKKTEDFEKFS